MSDAMSHAAKAKREAEQRLIQRGWVRTVEGFFWTKPGSCDEPRRLEEAWDEEFRTFHDGLHKRPGQ